MRYAPNRFVRPKRPKAGDSDRDKIKSKSAQDILLLFGVAMLFTGRHAELAVKLAGEGQGTP